MPDTHPYTIHVPPPEGGISIPVGQELWIHAAQACTFCCTIGANFSPSIANIQLSQGDNGPYTADTTGSGMYNTSDPNTTCTASAQGPTLIAKSIQIS
jgi:hypothetical protein